MSGTTAPLRAVPYDRYNGTIGAIFSVNLSLLLLCEAFIVSIYVMCVMFDLATKLVKKNGKGIGCVMFMSSLR